MDINQTPLSRYKSNRSRLNARSNLSSTTEVTNRKHMDSKALHVKPESLKEGQVIKGDIIDIRFQEVTFRLEPEHQLVTARLSSDVSLSIGQTAEFIVTDASTEQLTLRYIPQELSYQELTVQRALNASLLPLTERNRTLVLELLSHKLPIDKQTLQLLARMAGRFQELPPLTLVLMYKHHIPITKTNVVLFTNYQNGSHPILKDLQIISRDIADLIMNNVSRDRNIPNSISDTPGKTLAPDIPLPPIPMDSSIGYEILSANISKDYLTQLVDYVSVVFSGKAPIGAYLSPEELSLLSKELEQNNILENTSNGITSDVIKQILPEVDPAIINQIRGGSLPFEDVIHILTKVYDLDMDHFLQSQGNEQMESISDVNRILHHILEEHMTQREKLTSITQAIHDSEVFSRKQGSSNTPYANLHDVLTHSLDYRTILKEAFYKRWTLTPKEFSDPNIINDYYKALDEDMENLSILGKLPTTSDEHSILGRTIKDVQDNLQFIKTLNELFTYVQLPFHMKDRDFHGDFYIFNKKKVPPERKDNLSILLHLDMAELGPLNIHIVLELNQIQATFYTEYELANQLLRDHVPDLVNALSQKGYHLQARVELGKSRPDFIQDLLEKDSAEDSVLRYSFDVRA